MPSDQLSYNMLLQINSNLAQILKLLKDMQKNGIPVTTQESHTG